MAEEKKLITRTPLIYRQRVQLEIDWHHHILSLTREVKNQEPSTISFDLHFDSTTDMLEEILKKWSHGD